MIRKVAADGAGIGWRRHAYSAICPFCEYEGEIQVEFYEQTLTTPGESDICDSDFCIHWRGIDDDWSVVEFQWTSNDELKELILKFRGTATVEPEIATNLVQQWLAEREHRPAMCPVCSGYRFHFQGCRFGLEVSAKRVDESSPS